jgi:beta-catenin-like protein 1
MARIKAVKVLDHAFLTPYGHDLANKFIELMGLKTLFACFMKKGIKAYKKEYKTHFSEKEDDEHIMSIIVSLFKHATTVDSQLRLLAKFLDLEKMDQLVEMHFQYFDCVSALDQAENEENLDEEDEEMLYLDKLEGGLFTLQLVDLVLLNCISLEQPEETIKKHVVMLFQRRGTSLDSVKKVVKGMILEKFGENQ